MNAQPASEHVTTRWHRATHALGYLLVFGTAIRRVNELDETFSISLALALLTVFTALYASERMLSRRYMNYHRFYFAFQMIIVQILGVFQVYVDTWAILYIVLGLQVAVSCMRKEAAIWWGLFVASILGTLFFEFGILSGLGRGFAYIVLGIFFISFDSLYAQKEDSQSDSELLLHELQEAHDLLTEQARQAERLTAIQERSRMAQEMHDAIGQRIFAIQLMAETTSVLLEKDPSRAPAQLNLLQEQTQGALGQMRQLINRWRATAKDNPATEAQKDSPSRQDSPSQQDSQST